MSSNSSGFPVTLVNKLDANTEDNPEKYIPGVQILVGPQGGYDGGEVGGGGGGGDDEGEVGHRRGDGGPVCTGESWLWDRGGEAAIRLHQVVGHCSTTEQK